MKKLSVKLSILFLITLIFSLFSTAVLAKEDEAPLKTYEWTVDESVTLSKGTGQAHVSVLSTELENYEQLKITCPTSITLTNGKFHVDATVTFDDIILKADDDLIDNAVANISINSNSNYNAATKVMPVGNFEGILTFMAVIDNNFIPEPIKSGVAVVYANEFTEDGEALYEDFGQDVLLTRSEEEADEAILQEIAEKYYEALDFSSNIDYGTVKEVFCYYKLIDESTIYQIQEGNYWDIIFNTHFMDEEILCILLNNEELEPENWTITDDGNLKIRTSYGHGSIIIVTE